MRIIALYTIVLAAILLPAISFAAVMQGKVTVDAEPVAGVTVAAYPISSLDFNEPAPHRSQPSKSDGQFEMELPPGQYYVMAENTELFAFYGRNPVTVSEQGLQKVNLLLVQRAAPVAEMETFVETGVRGIVTKAGKPVSGAIVSVYTDLTSQLKGVGLAMSAPTDDQGLFELPMSAGNYYLVVRMRQSGQMVGPLRAGDLFGYLPQNPLRVEGGKVAAVHFPVIEVPEKVESYSDTLFGNTRITGRVLDEKGEPVAGLQVMLYQDSTLFNRPLYVSRKTSADGRYVISFPVGGHYYLAARNQLGGTPAPGELYGRYQGSDDHSVQVKTGQVLTDIDIVVEEVY